MSFSEVKKKLGFGFMRLKMNGDEVDYDETNRMIDTFLGAGFNYFDTAHTYIDGKSEIAIGKCLSARYKRDEFVLADKLSDWCFEKEEDIIPLFQSQLDVCGVDYFDFYLIHSITRKSYEKYKSCKAFETVKKLKDMGKIRHIAMSFHDSAEFLDEVLKEQKDIECVQLQINYLDFDDPAIQSKACYDVAVSHGKKVIVMEPVRGGALVNLPDTAAEILDREKGSRASFALRYAASFPEVFMVLSGMGNMDMMEDNINTFQSFVPFTDEEYKIAGILREKIRESRLIGCTGCDYCGEVCPKDIRISQFLGAYNGYLSAKMTKREAKEKFPKEGGALEDCIKCGKCEEICPQSIKIREQLERIGR